MERLNSHFTTQGYIMKNLELSLVTLIHVSHKRSFISMQNLKTFTLQQILDYQLTHKARMKSHSTPSVVMHSTLCCCVAGLPAPVGLACGLIFGWDMVLSPSSSLDGRFSDAHCSMETIVPSSTGHTVFLLFSGKFSDHFKAGLQLVVVD